MKKRMTKIMALLCASTICCASLTGCGNGSADTSKETAKATATPEATTEPTQNPEVQEEAATTPSSATAELPKYIFLFIGDGMSYPQVQSTNYYLSAMEDDTSDKILQSKSHLTFMNFPVAGSAQTYDSTSFCPDSASTATSISTGHKTYSGTINMDETMTTAYKTISEKLKEEKDYKIGVLSSVNLNHATPAAFYAHQASRNNYYEIGVEMVESGFDYFAGGALKSVTGENEDQKDLYKLAEEAGYKVVKTQAEAENLTSADEKVIAITETLADSDSMSYEIDRAESEWSLADYVDKGIELLDNENGFFMMVEGGKIDWACHANDAGSAIHDTMALSDAVDEALEFYNEHPDETLIIVTGDHETGGLTIGFAGTNYDTFLTNFENQKISYVKYDSDYVNGYVENNTDFDTVMKDITSLFGLKTPGSGDSETDSLVMTDYEYNKLKTAYEKTLELAKTENAELSQEEYVLYGTYTPLSVTITHILNNKSGVSFASYAHTGLPVGVFAIGAGQEKFEGYYDNTDIFNKLVELTGVTK